MKSIYILMVFLLSFQSFAQENEDSIIENQSVAHLMEKISENSFTVFKDQQILYTKTTKTELTQVSIDIETGNVHLLNVSGDQVFEYKTWIDVTQLDYLDSDVFAKPHVISSHSDTMNKSDVCRGLQGQAETAYNAYLWAVAYGTAEDIANAEAWLTVAIAQLLSCVEQVQTHQK